MLTRVSFFYIDPQNMLLDGDVRFGAIDFHPRLFFVDPELWHLAAKLREAAMRGGAPDAQDGEVPAVLSGTKMRLMARLRIPAASNAGA